MTIRLVTVDAVALVRMGIAHAVAGCDDIELVAEARTAAEARRIVPESSATVVTLDVALADGDGLALARELRAELPNLGVVVLANANDALLFRALEAGLSAFVPRSAPATDVVSSIRHAAVAGTSFSTPGLAAALARRRPGSALLSNRELEILDLMQDGASVRLMAGVLHVSESTAKTYVTRVYSKLHVNNRSQALMTAVRRGLLSTSDLRAG